MPKATEIHRVTDRVVIWSAFEPSLKSEMSSAAWRSDEGWVLVDPIDLSAEAREELEVEATPIAIFLTNENHARHSEAFRKRWKIPIWSAPEAVAELEVKVDETFNGSEVFELQPVAIPGATAGETVFLTPQGVAMIGDAIVNLPGYEFVRLPKKYAKDDRQNQKSLQKLLDFPLEILTFAHGLPVRGRIRERLSAAISET